MEIVELPEQDVVMATLVGPYDQISEAHARIGEFIQAEGLRAATGGIEAKVFNRYLTDPSQTAPDANVTELCLPIHPPLICDPGPAGGLHLQGWIHRAM